MADYKELQTRLVNRWDTLDNWNNSTLTLLEGEIALAYVETKQEKSDANGNIHIEYVPTYIMKVGAKNKDGRLQTFKELPLLHAPASDVYAWAKLENPTIEQLPNNLKTEFENIGTKFGSVTGTTGSNTYATVDALVAAAINALDAPDAVVDNQFVTAVAQNDGTIAVTRRSLEVDDIPELPETKVTNLQQLRKIVVGDQMPTGYTKDPVLDRLDNLETLLDGITGPMEFLGISSSDPVFTLIGEEGNEVNYRIEGAITIGGTELTSFAKGEIVAYGTKEYVCTVAGDKATSIWALLGDVTATDKEVTALKGRVSTAEANIGDLEKAIYGAEGGDLPADSSGNLLERMTNAESNISNIQTDINTNIIRSNAQNILTQGVTTTKPEGSPETSAKVILLCCGKSGIRDGVDNLTIPST